MAEFFGRSEAHDRTLWHMQNFYYFFEEMGFLKRGELREVESIMGLKRHPSIEDIAKSPARRGCHDLMRNVIITLDDTVFLRWGTNLVYLSMEKLFASKNIRIQLMEDLYGSEINIAYTGKLLDLNVLIEFSGITVDDDPSLSEEVGVFANYFENGVVHSYVLFVSGEILGPLPVFRIIADAIEFIEKYGQEMVKENLKAIATFYEAIDRTHDNLKYYQNAVFKHTRGLELIKKSREKVN